MPEVQRILRQYDRAMNGSPWHGDPIWQILDGISAEAAASRPIANAHSMWELVGHMTFWEGVAAKRLAGLHDGPEPEDERNFPLAPEATDTNWQKTLDQFRASNKAFREALQKLDPARLDKLSAAGKRSFYDEAHGLIEHHVYHAGQIALLAKAVQRS
ncbi:MAG: DinB family protein [Candidatus Korobacteraceae bacterium]